MARMHVFELADQEWYPRTLANAGTAYLRVIEKAFKAGEILAPPVQAALTASGRDRIVDLGSGSGGPAVDVVATCGVPVTLTDRYPDVLALTALASDTVGVHPEPVDAAAVPKSLPGVRTLFNAFHHFEDPQALAVLQDAVRAGEPIVVLEMSERAPQTVLGSALIPLFVFLAMPFVRPVNVLWLLLTYVVPVLPWAIAWDGLVSHLRTRNPQELDALTAQLDAPGWTWKSEKIPVKGANITALTGLPPT
jgi:hypothetical protein